MRGLEARHVIYTITGGMRAAKMKKTISLMKKSNYTITSMHAERDPTEVITFSKADECQERSSYDDALVISAIVANFDVRRILVDTGSSVNVLFLSSYKLMGFDVNSLVALVGPIYGFAGERKELQGEIVLPMQMGDKEGSVVKLAIFFGHRRTQCL